MIYALISFLREWYRHPIQLVLSIFGIAVGVATIVAIDLANYNASESFQKSNDLLNGLATHRISGDAQGIDQEVFRWLKVDMGVSAAIPVIESKVVISEDNHSVTLLGIDPFSERRIRSLGTDLNLSSASPFTVYISAEIAQRYPDYINNKLTLSFAGEHKNFSVGGVIDLDNNVLDNILITDIGAAQVFVGMGDNISYIDLRLENHDVERIENNLPIGSYLIDLNARNYAQGEMTRAFKTNLFALGLLALVVGMFLVFNTVSFQMLRRKELFALLRVLGFTHRGLFSLLMTEAFILGLLGTVIGIGSGMVLSQLLYGLVTNTINELYYEFAPQVLQIPTATLSKAVFLGIGASLLAVAYPAWDSRRRALVSQMARSSVEISIFTSSKIVWLAVLCMMLAIAMIYLGTSLWSAFAALFLLIISMCFPLPFVLSKTVVLTTKTRIIFSQPVLLLAVRSITESLSRTGLAAIALSIAVATTLGVSLMIDSFRFSVDQWLNNYLRADVYISASRADSAMISPQLLDQISALENIKSVSLSRRSSVQSNFGAVDLFVLDTNSEGFKSFQIKSTDVEHLWDKFHNDNAALISESFAARLGLNLNDVILLNTQQGFIKFTIAAVYYDYSSEHGVIALHANSWNKYNSTVNFRSIALYLHNNEQQSIASTLDFFQKTLSQSKSLFISSNKALKDEVLKVFDQTFEITNILRLLTILIAMSAIISALLCVQLERRHQLSILRAIGFTRLNLALNYQISTAVMGFVIGIFSIPIGITLCIVLIDVINQRSFGWSMQMLISPALLMQSLIIAIVSSLVAGMLSTLNLRTFNIAQNLKRD